MTTKKCFIYVIICILSCNIICAQELYRQINTQQPPSFFPAEALKMDINKSPVVPAPNRYLHRQTNNGFYPVKGEMYYNSDTEKVGDIYFEIGQNGLLDKRISICNHPSLYDSTVSVMNRTSYTKGKNLVDTVHNYWKKSDGSYQLDRRLTYSYHYLDHFEGDSLFFEYISQFWDDNNKQWINHYREKMGYHDTSVLFYNRNTKQIGDSENTWKIVQYMYDSITYNQQGFVDTLYMIRDNQMTSKAAFTCNEQGHYTQIDYFIKKGNNWVEGDVFSNITWVEWNGFMYPPQEQYFGGEPATPYKRTKVNSFDIKVATGDELTYFIQKRWDIDGTRTNRDTSWSMMNGKKNQVVTNEHIYNEYGDYEEWRNTALKYFDENEDPEMTFYSGYWYKHEYDELYGMTEEMIYQISLNKGKLDTVFLNGFKYTDFAPVSIVEHPQTKQTLHIFPNPASGAVIISATAEIEQLRVFDITGRLVSDQSPESRQVVFDTGVLPQGIYLVQARLRDGRVQMGKLVVR